MREAKGHSDGKAFGYVLVQHKDELGMVKSKEELYDLVKTLCSPEANNLEQQKYLDGMLSTIRNSSFLRGYQYIYNIILKGEGLGSQDAETREVRKAKVNGEKKSNTWKDNNTLRRHY